MIVVELIGIIFIISPVALPQIASKQTVTSSYLTSFTSASSKPGSEELRTYVAPISFRI